MRGRATGCCKGKGGSLHFCDPEHGVAVGNVIVAAGIPFAAGIALSATLQKNDRVSLAFFGDGAVNQGAFHEAMNMATVWKLPLILVCENNLYAMGTALALSESETDIQRKAACYRIASEAVDGMDIIAVEAAARRAVHALRSSGKPFFLNLGFLQPHDCCYWVFEHGAGVPLTRLGAPPADLPPLLPRLGPSPAGRRDPPGGRPGPLPARTPPRVSESPGGRFPKPSSPGRQ